MRSVLAMLAILSVLSAACRAGAPIAVADPGKAAVDLVASMPEVKGYCAALERAPQPSHCTMWPEEPAARTSCAANAAITDDCLRPVYLGESHPEHAVRFATLYVNSTTSAVVAASDLVCGLMPIDQWRKLLQRRAAAPQGESPNCPE